MAEAAEPFEMDVGDFVFGKGCSEGVVIELRIVAGFWNGADIEELRDTVGLEQREEFAERARGVADGENERLGCGAFWHGSCGRVLASEAAQSSSYSISVRLPSGAGRTRRK